MSEIILSILGGSVGAALAAGVMGLVTYRIQRRDQKTDAADVQSKALRYIMLYIIQERAKQLLGAGEISLNERRSLHHWHSLYHDGLGGNGDADALMGQVDQLPLRTDSEALR